VIIPVFIFTRGWLAERRVERRYRNELSRELPPLPRPHDRERMPGGRV
jgi:hypothetical protein